jgi:hypothetical protein
MLKDLNEARAAFEKLCISHNRAALTPLERHLELYQDILDCLPEGALKRLFIRYSGYEPYESMVRDWWNFYDAMYEACKNPRKHRSGYKAVIFMWATRATRRMESDR